MASRLLSAAMGSKLSCLSDGTVQHVDAHTLRSHESSTRTIDTKPQPSTATKRLASSSSLDTTHHKQSTFSHHATTLQHSARSSLSLAHPFEHLRLQSVDDKEKVEVEVDEQLKTTVSSSATSSLASSPRQMHAILTGLEQQSALSRVVTASSFVVASSSPSPSPVSRTLRHGEHHDGAGKAVLEECKEQQPAVADSRPSTHHQRGFSDSSAAIRPVSDASSLTNPPKDGEMLSKRSPYTDSHVKRVITAVQPSPHHSRRPTLIQPTLAPSASSTSLSSAVSPSASPVSSVVESHYVSSSTAAGHTLPPSVHLTSINLRIAASGNSANIPEPCPSPLDLTRSLSSPSASASASVQPLPPPPPPKADIHHQLDEVLIFRAITAYHREHRDEGLGPSWWTAHSLVVAGSERERERVRRSERVISISGGMGVYVTSGGGGGKCVGGVCGGEWLSEDEAMCGSRLLQNSSTIGSFLRSINA